MFKKLIKKLKRWIDKIFEKICYPFSDNEDEEDIQQYKDYEKEFEDFFNYNKTESEKES